MYVKKMLLLMITMTFGMNLLSCNENQVSDLDEFSQRTDFGARGGLAAKTLTLTFDDGPGPRTLELARYLADEGISATFFVLANAASKNLQVLAELQELGHIVANHTVNHPSMPSLDTSAVLYQVRQTHRVIEPYLTDGIQVFRAPFGAWSGRVARDLNRDPELREYVGPIFWDIGGETYSSSYPYDADWACQNRGTSAQLCADRYFRESQARRGGIVLFHDIHNVTIEMVKILVPRWKSNGYTFARIDDVPVIREALLETDTYLNDDLPIVKGEIACPENYELVDVNDAEGQLCTDGVNARGPFTQSMIDLCLSWGGGEAACSSQRWSFRLARSAYGSEVCPRGATLDRKTGYCREGQDAFGPFPQEFIDVCESVGGGSACQSSRWNHEFLYKIMQRV